MSNYTAGPWQVQDPSGLLSVQIVKQPDKCICSVYKLFFEDAEALANARLMAAAPELLEALQAAHRFLRKIGDKRPDEVVKPELIKQLPYPVTAIFEYRTRVVQKWRELGYTCLQVCDGNY